MNNPGEVFRNTSRCSYNPFPDTIKLQRCNYPGQQVFYCSMYSDTNLSSTSFTCIFETALEQIQNFNAQRIYCTLSRWQCKRPLRLWVLPFSEISSAKNHDFNRIQQNIITLIKDKANSEEGKKSLEYISRVFVEGKNKQTYYKISSAFYNALCSFEKLLDRRYDGLIYPSANTEGAGMNVALKKELIDDKILHCDIATMYSITRSPNNAKELRVVPASNNAWADELGRLQFTSIF